MKMEKILIIMGMIKELSSVIEKVIRVYWKKSLWRYYNKSNNTFVANGVNDNSFPNKKVTVGKYSYGPLKVISYNSSDPSLRIGCFCSIAEDVKFMLGGNHYYKSLLSFPVRSFVTDQAEALSNGEIIVDDDVWIGAGSTIMSGVHLAKGTIVAAGAVVTHSTTPYTIVAGIPAKKIKSRFSDAIIEKLMQIDLAKVDKQFMFNNVSLLTKDIDEEVAEIIGKNIDCFVQK